MNKILLFLIGLLTFVSTSAQQAEGVIVPGSIIASDSMDNYYTHDDWFGRVGFKIVSTIARRDLIPANRRVEGMLVYVQSTARYYKLQDCTENECWIDNRLDTLFGGTHSTGRITVQAKDYDPSFLFDGYTVEGYQRFGVSKNGLLIAGRRMPMTINVDGLAIIGDRNDLTGADAFAFGKDVSALSDSSGGIGYNLQLQHYNSMLIGRGKYRTQKLVTQRIKSLGIGFMQTIPQLQLTEDTVRITSSVLWWNGEPISGGTGSSFPSKYFKLDSIHYSVGFGANPLPTASGNNNTSVGYQSGHKLTNGTENSLFGYKAAYWLTTGTGNTGIGDDALNRLTTASRNIAIGRSAGYWNTTLNDRLFIGGYWSASISDDTTKSILYGNMSPTLVTADQRLYANANFYIKHNLYLSGIAKQNTDTLATKAYARSVGGGTGSMVYPGAGIPISTGSAWGTSLTDNSTNWNTAYTDRLKWDGGSTGLTAATGRTSLGATTVGSNLFTLANPSAVTFMRINADNTVTARSATDFKTDLSIVTPDTSSTGKFASKYFAESHTFIVALSGEKTNLTVDTLVGHIYAPFAFRVSDIFVSVVQPGTGSTIIYDIKKNFTSILSTKVSIDASEKTSLTAASAYALTNANTSFAKGDYLSIRCDQIGSSTSGKGAQITINVKRTDQ